MADLVKNYLKLRGQNKNDALLKLLTDDIVLSDSDSNEHKGNFVIFTFSSCLRIGLGAVGEYYQKNPCGETNWEEPTVESDLVKVSGKVKGTISFCPLGLSLLFKFKYEIS